MIIIEYLICGLLAYLTYYTWDTRERTKGTHTLVFKLGKEIAEEFGKQTEKLNFSQDVLHDVYAHIKQVGLVLDATRNTLELMEEDVLGNRQVMDDRLDDIQRTVFTKVDFDMYLESIREKNKAIEESIDKLKKDRLKSLKIAFGGKDDE